MKRNQQGYVLLAMTVILAALAAVMLIQGMGATLASNTKDEQRRSLRAMKEAKMALIVRALTNDNTAGAFACPDTSTTGIGSPIPTNCPSTSQPQFFGCVPWKTLGLEPSTQQGISPLWYALTPAFSTAPTANERADSPAKQINLDNPGRLTLINANNNTSQTIIAAIMSPGFELTGQRQPRQSLNNCDPQQAARFFETVSTLLGNIDNAAHTGTLVTANASQSFNDLILPITRDDLYKPLLPFVLQPFAADAAGTHGLRWFLSPKSPVSSNLFKLVGTEIPITVNALQLSAAGSGMGQKAAATLNRTAYLTSTVDLSTYTTELPTLPHFDLLFNPTSALQNKSIGTSQCQKTLTDPKNKNSSTEKTPITWLCTNNWYDYINYQAQTSDQATLLLLLDKTRSDGYGCRLDINRTNNINEQVRCGTNISDKNL